MSAADFLVEIGTEELPPKALRTLMDAFGAGVEAGIDEARLEHGAVEVFASPRRLAVLIESLAAGQPDRTVTQKGPPVSIALDDDGNPKPPATAFAKKFGVDVSDLERQTTDKGEWLSFEATESGRPTRELIGDIVAKALDELPIPRRMRWGAGDIEFVRPVHWIVMLHGEAVVGADVLGVRAGNESRGHRVHSQGPVVIAKPGDYVAALESDGYVVADFDQRRRLVEGGVAEAAVEAGGAIIDGESLYDEVTALVEWPVALLGHFDDEYLELPREVVISTLTGHQRYFAVAGSDGELLPCFVTVANLESREHDKVRDGNERVVRPRLADAAFFWENDRRVTLASRQDSLREVVYQRGLGSLFDKSGRTAALAGEIARDLDVDRETVERAAFLSKCDLLTGMVGEFPDLQGIMGRYFAESDGEPDAVAQAIGEHYQPRFAGDALPATAAGRILAVADRLDTLAGIFTIGKKPSGNRDPFGLRRSALGIARILIECELDVDLIALIRDAADAQPAGKVGAEDVADDVYAFVTDRLKRYFLDRDDSLAAETFDAVLARHPRSLVDFDRRLKAVQAFTRLDAAESLAAANKRIDNLLRKAGDETGGAVAEQRLEEDAEKALYTALGNTRQHVVPLIEKREYEAALEELAGLRAPVDRFFDDVMVMVDDAETRNNRLALLADVRALFLDVADISRLVID